MRPQPTLSNTRLTTFKKISGDTIRRCHGFHLLGVSFDTTAFFFMTTIVKPFLLLYFCFLFCVQPGRSTGVVPPDTLWHIRMMSPPVRSKERISNDV